MGNKCCGGLHCAGPEEQKFIKHILSLSLEERARALVRVSDAVWQVIARDVRVSPALVRAAHPIREQIKGELLGKTQTPYWLSGVLLLLGF